MTLCQNNQKGILAFIKAAQSQPEIALPTMPPDLRLPAVVERATKRLKSTYGISGLSTAEGVSLRTICEETILDYVRNREEIESGKDWTQSAYRLDHEIAAKFIVKEFKSDFLYARICPDKLASPMNPDLITVFMNLAQMKDIFPEQIEAVLSEIEYIRRSRDIPEMK
jgi:hypothetical protein